MISDARTLPADTTLTADIAVIGAGPAAIAMARVWAGLNLKVLILESGGLDLEPAAQDLHRGSRSGVPYFELHESRFRTFGGSTYRWGSRSAPFQEIDMIHRPWLEAPHGHNGWPITRAALQPYYDRVPELQNLHVPFDNENPPWEKFAVTPPKLNPDTLRYGAFQFGKNLLFGEVYRAELKAAGNIDVLLHATVTRIAASARADHIDRLDVSTDQGKRFTVTARRYVLATGGIENARLLLLSDDVMPMGLANTHDHVGRYFMEHPTASAGTVETATPQKLHDIFSPGLISGRLIETCLAPTRAMMEENRILNVAAATRLNVGVDATQALREIMWNMRARKMPRTLGWYRNNNWLKERAGAIARDPFSIVGNVVRHAMGRPKRFKIDSVRLELRSEQAPNPLSRVTLGTERDALGQRRAHLNWALSETDWRSMQVMAHHVGAEMTRLNLGTLHLADWLKGDTPSWPSDLVGGHHHMGTTRMSAAPKDGVVDANLRCHGIDNLFIAGSSVYPTSSFVNPTTTVLALALRLADQLKADLA